MQKNERIKRRDQIPEAEKGRHGDTRLIIRGGIVITDTGAASLRSPLLLYLGCRRETKK